ncbi:hypothetical protein ACF0H5_010647 [Mactra antiquata]
MKQVKETKDEQREGDHTNDFWLDQISFYEERKSHIQTICSQIENDAVNGQDGNTGNYCKLPDTNNISFCKVPKCGSTTWMQIFNILQYGIESANTFLEARRFDLHRNYTCKLHSIGSENKGIIISRDPYSRLYSAYVDKSFITFHTKVGQKSVRNLNGNCTGMSSVDFETFQDFLDKILPTIEVDYDVNLHWKPIYKLCSPCTVDVFIHVKLEEMTRDMDFVFKKIGLSSELQNTLRQVTRSKESSLSGIVATIFMKMENKLCLQSEVVADRIWNSFQIQGYIDITSKFPKDEYLAILSSGQYISETDAFMKVVSNEMAKHSMSKTDSLKQRRAVLVSAYSQLRPDTIARIQEVYKLDFVMFNYSMNPPSK